ncbi:MAG: hypothetical protein LV481_11695 [Methylacidiphilales bacterium]|nr:hypothetical protein [Candidatus Methylacidiphilales bacterium]
MHGMPHLVMAAVGIPSAWQCLSVAAPFLAFAALRWVIHRVDRTVEHLFPHWEWERRMGWLNLRVQRRADTILRWIGYFLYALLALALYGIIWAAPTLGQLDRWSDPGFLNEISLKLSVLLVSLGFWLVYLGFDLLPKLRRQHETEELEKFRAELAGRETEDDHPPKSRFASPLEKPRASTATRPGRFRSGN